MVPSGSKGAISLSAVARARTNLYRNGGHLLADVALQATVKTKDSVCANKRAIMPAEQIQRCMHSVSCIVDFTQH
jgi:hypothetical protein